MPDVSALIKQNQDKAEMLHRSLGMAVKLYAEKTHFVYELLQNAEDAGATRVRFLQFDDHLEVLHDGKPFTLSNVLSLCDAANSDKNDGGNKIGKFGVGFKSVFTICSTVDLYSEPSNRLIKDALGKFAIRIEHYTDPININGQWNIAEPYTTRFLFPYDYSKYYKSQDDLKKDIAKKLANLGTSVLLFMKNIQEIHYLICGAGENYDGHGSYMLDRQSLGDNICKVTALGETNNKADDNSFLVFSKYIEQTERTVDIAYSILEKEGKLKFTKTASPFVSVYFPTETESKLNFIVQAPFDLTPNRSSLEQDSDINAEMVSLLSDLFKESIMEIRNRKLLSFDFLDLLPYDSGNPAFSPKWHFYDFHVRVRELFRKEAIIPAIDGSYIGYRDARIQRSAKLMELLEGERLCALVGNPNAKWLPKHITENSPLKALHGFLKALGVREIGSNDLPRLFKQNPSFLESADEDWLVLLYSFLARDVKHLLGRNGDLATVPFIKALDGRIAAPFALRRQGRANELEPNLFLKPVGFNQYIQGLFLFIDDSIAERCGEFVSLLGLSEPEGYNYFLKELELTNSIDQLIELNADHVKRAIVYLREGREKAAELFSGLLRLKVTNQHGAADFIAISGNTIYRAHDYNGVSLSDYFAGIDSSIYILDESFYYNEGINPKQLKELEQLGIKSTVYSKLDEKEWSCGARCYNIAKFRKNLHFDHIDAIIKKVQSDCANNDFMPARRKSAAVFALALNVEEHLQGQWQFRTTNPEIRSGFAQIAAALSCEKWLLTSNGLLASPGDISKDELDERTYGKINRKSEIYEILGFKKTESDKREELVRAFCAQYSQEQQEEIIKSIVGVEAEEVFDPEVDESRIDFPIEKIKDRLRLILSIRRRYSEAPHVTYSFVSRRIRTSRTFDKLYLRYKYKGYCQLCKKPSRFWEVAELFNAPKKELCQMNLSLCPNCASEYRILRNNKALMNKLAENILNADLSKDPSIAFGGKSLRFTAVHLAEIQVILGLEEQ